VFSLGLLRFRSSLSLITIGRLGGSVEDPSYQARSWRVFATSVALGPLEPLSLAGASLEVWCD
jgi:hypothetical protein